MTANLKYRATCRGFLRMNVCGWRFVLIDTSKHRPCFSDRTRGFRIGRFVARATYSPPVDARRVPKAA